MLLGWKSGLELGKCDESDSGPSLGDRQAGKLDPNPHLATVQPGGLFKL